MVTAMLVHMYIAPFIRHDLPAAFKRRYEHRHDINRPKMVDWPRGPVFEQQSRVI